MKTLYIITMATSLYNQYLPFLYLSLKHFKLKFFNIKVIVISDEQSQYIKDNNFLYYPIAYLPYSYNTYFKPLTIQHALRYFDISDNEYIMFIDADTYIRESRNYIYFERCLLSDKMIFSISPWVNYCFTYENELCENNYKEVYIENIQKEDFIQFSFFAGKIKSFNIFCNKYFDLMQIFTKDWQNKRIPPMSDQSIATKLIHDEKELYIKDYFLVNDYSEYTLRDIRKYIQIPKIYCKKTFNIFKYRNVFLYQKFNQSIKSNIRYSI